MPDVAFVAADLGFRGKPRSPETPKGAVVAVGHSLGGLWLMQERPVKWNALILINGFSRFTEAGGFGPAVKPRALAMMMRRLKSDPKGTAVDFMKTCGIGEIPKHLDPRRLATGLEWLRDWDVRGALDGKDAPDLALASLDDPVVPAAMTAACFESRLGDKLVWSGKGGHLLPQARPDWCAKEIRKFLGNL